MGKIVVVGSINADLVTTSDYFPLVGETVTGKSYTMLAGGKGANQAVCAAKLGADVSFIGCVGNDSNGQFLLKNIKDQDINIAGIEVLNNVPTGIAQITVANNDNTIIFVPGANRMVTEAVVNKHLELIDRADLVMLQLETPLKTVEYVVRLCVQQGKKVILNPAPPCDLSTSLINQVTYLTPNQVELAKIFKEKRDVVLERYPNKVIMTGGGEGAYYHNGSQIVNVKGFKVKVIDTTGAGDSFNGALAYALTKNYPLKDAIKFSNKVASKTVQVLGAQTAMPTMKELSKQKQEQKSTAP